MKTIAWYWHRVHAMSAEELITRSIFAIRKIAWRKRKKWYAPTPSLDGFEVQSVNSFVLDTGEEKLLVLAEVQQYLNHKFELLNVEFRGDEIDWHLDPETGIRSPVTFGLDIDYRNRNVVGNIKNIWELNRHHHLTLLAVAYVLTLENKYAEEVECQLESWLKANLFLLGVNWHSSLEVGTRLISWVWIERLLRGSASHQKLFGAGGILWTSIYRHQWFIYHNRSCGSSSNNHLAGELTGLFIASSAWPYFEESSSWEKVSRKGLEKEVERQTFPSGLNREIAFSYHIYTSELFLLAALEARRYKNPFSFKY